MPLLELWRTYSTVINGGLLLGIFTMILRHQILSRRVAIAEKANNREGYGDLIDRLEKRAKDVEEKLTRAEDRTTVVQGQLEEATAQMGSLRAHLAQALSGTRLLMDELESKDPTNAVAKRVRLLLAATFRDLDTPGLPKSATLGAAEHAVSAAEKTVTEIKIEEEGNR